MIILKEEVVGVADISKYKGMNVGYHAGDLGKSEYLQNQRGSNRGTGHFGTGTYFVGNIENINLGTYKDRPLHVVDFTPYRLYKPSSYNARKFHEALKYVNAHHERFMNGGEWNSKDMVALRNGDHETRVELLRKYSWLVDPNNPEEIDRDFQQEARMSIEDYLSGEESYYTDEYFEKFVEDLKDFYKEKMRKVNDALFELHLLFNLSEEKIKQMLDDIFSEIKQNPDRHSDSASTRFMKRIGYEGVDVRHIPNMDDTEFGSVIYDLKPETILE